MTSFATHMKRSTALKAGIATLMLSSMGVMQSAYAVGTASGTDINNTATVNYSVGGVAQTAVNSNLSTFKVDRKVNLNVVNNGGTNISTAPGAANVAAIYTVTNTGNGGDSFTFAPTNQTGDQFDVTNLRVYRDTNGNDTYDAGDTLIPAATAVAFTADQQIKFFIVSDIPLTATNTQAADVRLTATTTSTQTAGADNPAVVDVLFADTGSDGIEFATNRYVISSATLAVVKSAAIISDPINGAGANRKAIPGAVIQYSIVVTNSGASNATAVALSDAIPANTTYVANSMTLNAAALTDGADADAGTSTGSPVTSISVNAGTVNSGGGSATVTFRVTINN